MQASDFTGDFPGHLVEIGRGSCAFVPYPLPSELDLDPPTVRQLARAERALGRLSGTLGATGRGMNPHLITAPLFRREALSSSRIEGTVSTPEQLALLELAPSLSTDEGDVSQAREVLNYMRAQDHGFARLRELPVCLRVIRELHEILLRGVRGNADDPGRFRSVQNFIGSSSDIREARFVPPPPLHLDACLRQFEAALYPKSDDDDRLPHLVRIALLHYQFETIHPFRDGNGRVGRLLIPMLLCAYERLDVPTIYISSYLEKHRSQYTDLMLRVSQTGDYLGWVRFFLEAVAVSAEESVTRAEALLALREEYHHELHEARSSALLLKLVDALFERPSMSISAAAKHLGVTAASASASLQKLAARGIVTEVTGNRRNQSFLAPRIISVAYSD